MKNTHENHRQRMREKYMRHDEKAFDTHQLFEMLLFGLQRRRDTNPTAHELLEKFPKGKLFSATIGEIQSVEGIGKVGATELKISLDASRRLMCEAIEGEALDNSFRRSTFVYVKLLGRKYESVCVFFLTPANKFAGEREIEGGMRNPSEYYKNIIKEAKAKNADKIIICHSHGAKEALPSAEDIYVTEFMKKALEKTGIELADHYIVSETDCKSIIDFGKDENG